MPIVKAKQTHLEQCVDLLFIPEMGQLYYPKRDLLRLKLENSLDKDEVYVDTDGETIQGVIWYQVEGLFHSFPYLHMIAVRNDCRKKGVGSRLMAFFEQDSLQKGRNKLRTRCFLLVSDLNQSAQQFYKEQGYEEIGSFENLFRKGLTERLFMKRVKIVKKEESGGIINGK